MFCTVFLYDSDIIHGINMPFMTGIRKGVWEWNEWEGQSENQFCGLSESSGYDLRFCELSVAIYGERTTLHQSVFATIIAEINFVWY